MKKKGFTLIELLAVIVVLAIIALIAIPIVMNAIEKSKKGAAERTADNYIDAVEIAAATSKLDGKDILDGTYQIDEDGNLLVPSLPSGKLTVDMNGNKPSGGTISIKNNSVDQGKSNIKIGDYVVSYDKDNNKQTAEELYKGVLCTKKDGVDLNNLVVGNEFTCELGDNDTKTFYVLETNGDNVSLIMNANIDSNGKAIMSSDATDKGLVAWITVDDWKKAGGVVTDAMRNDEGPCQYGNVCLTNEFGPLTAEATLKANTKTWTRLVSTQIVLPTGKQVATAGGDTEWTEKNYTGTTLSTWLYDNLNGTTNAVSGVYGYWTSTPYISDSYACFVYHDGFLGNNGVDDSSRYGIRPVIIISKSNLK